MADTHPIYQRPRIHCGRCDHALVFPRKRADDAEDIKAGRAVLAECVVCAVAVQVPAQMFKPSVHTLAKTTIARKLGAPNSAVAGEPNKGSGTGT